MLFFVILVFILFVFVRLKSRRVSSSLPQNALRSFSKYLKMTRDLLKISRVATLEKTCYAKLSKRTSCYSNTFFIFTRVASR